MFGQASSPSIPSLEHDAHLGGVRRSSVVTATCWRNLRRMSPEPLFGYSHSGGARRCAARKVEIERPRTVSERLTNAPWPISHWLPAPVLMLAAALPFWAAQSALAADESPDLVVEASKVSPQSVELKVTNKSKWWADETVMVVQAVGQQLFPGRHSAAPASPDLPYREPGPWPEHHGDVCSSGPVPPAQSECHGGPGLTTRTSRRPIPRTTRSPFRSAVARECRQQRVGRRP